MNLMSLDCDSFFEVLSHVPPGTILSIARTCRELRRILMSRSSISVWKTAFSMLDDETPSCPKNLSLPAWAHLLFDSSCHNCLVEGNRRVQWTLQVRLCSHCASVCLFNARDIPELYGRNRNILRCIPFGTWPGRSGTFGLKTDAARFLLECERVPPSDITHFLTAKAQEVTIRGEHGEQCQVWSDNIVNDRTLKMAAVRRERCNMISRRLGALGFTDELSFLTRVHTVRRSDSELPLFHKHPLVNRPQTLTELSWTRIVGRMRIYMASVRTCRNARLRLVVIHNRKLILAQAWYEWLRYNPWTYFVPRMADVAELPEIVTLVHAPTGVEISRDMLDAALLGVDESVRQWRERGLRELSLSVQSFLPVGLNTQSYDDRLKLATCIFFCIAPTSIGLSVACKPTGDLMWHPEFLDHCCNHRNLGAPRPCLITNDAGIGDYCDDNWSVLSCKLSDTWGIGHLKFHHVASRVARGILLASGIDPDRACVALVDELDPRLVCMTCVSQARPGVAVVFPWRRAVEHALRRHAEDHDDRWYMVPIGPTSEVQIPHGSRHHIDFIWLCSRCRYEEMYSRPMSKLSMSNHLIYCHNVTGTPVEGLDFYRAWDTPKRSPPVFEIDTSNIPIDPMIHRSQS